MLYLAEVQKKQQFIGGYKAEFKLLACQRNDQSWTAVSGDELLPVPTDDIPKVNDTQMVLVELGGNKQVQRILPDTGRSLVTQLSNYSRQLEKAKKQEEEIEQWKQSLTFQSQELNRREMELEARLEQLQQVEEDFERLEQQRQEIESAREETEKLRQEYERSQQEMEGAWEHLRGEQRRLEEKMADFTKQSAVLDEAQAAKIQELLNRLSGSSPTEVVQEEVNSALTLVNSQQEALNQHWQQLEQEQNTAQNLAAEVDRQTQSIQTRKQEWEQVKAALEQAKIELKVQETALNIKQESLSILNDQLEKKQHLYEQVFGLASGVADGSVSQKVDIQALENMPLGQLQETVQNLQQEVEKTLSFVNSQEEELSEKQRTIEQLQAKIQQASEYERISLEAELTEEQDAYQFLAETLGPQRQNVREREEIVNLNLRILRRRQGIMDNTQESAQKIDLQPILSQLDAQRQQQQEEVQKLESEIEQMRLSIGQTQEAIARQTSTHEEKQKEWQNMEQSLQESKVKAAAVTGKVNLYQEMLQNTQDSLNTFKQKVEAIAGVVTQIQENRNHNQQAITEMQQIFNGLLPAPV